MLCFQGICLPTYLLQSGQWAALHTLLIWQLGWRGSSPCSSASWIHDLPIHKQSGKAFRCLLQSFMALATLCWPLTACCKTCRMLLPLLHLTLLIETTVQIQLCHCLWSYSIQETKGSLAQNRLAPRSCSQGFRLFARSPFWTDYQRKIASLPGARSPDLFFMNFAATKDIRCKLLAFDSQTQFLFTLNRK